MRLRFLLAIPVLSGSQLLAAPSAKALNAPAEIPVVDNTLQISGGIDGYVYGQTGSAPKGGPDASAVGDSPYFYSCSFLRWARRAAA